VAVPHPFSRAMGEQLEDKGFRFGIYPLSVAGIPTGLATGPPDDYANVTLALTGIGGRRTPRSDADHSTRTGIRGWAVRP
jgi:hypothetical protein